MGTGILKDFIDYTLDIGEYIIYMLVSIPFTLVQRILTSQNLPYERCAELRRVLWKRKWFEIDLTSPRDFLTWHIKAVHPNYILRPTVSLYAVTEEVAVFVETPEGIDIFRSDINPFLYIAQFQHCKRVITMPIQSFHRLAREIGDPSKPVIWISNTGRCGSTILGQLFEAAPGNLLLSENDAPSNLAYMREARLLTEEQHEYLLGSVIKVLCKPHPNTNRYCLKTRSCSIIQMELISYKFPHIKHLFLYRNALETVSSTLDFSLTGRIRLLFRRCAENDLISFVVPYFRDRYKFLAIKHESKFKHQRNMNPVEMVITMWASTVARAKCIVSHDKKFLPLKYEDLSENPRKFSEILFHELGISTTEVASAIAALKKDSQRGSVFGERRIGKDPWRNVNSSNRIKANAILLYYNVPLLGEDCRI